MPTINMRAYVQYSKGNTHTRNACWHSLDWGRESSVGQPLTSPTTSPWLLWSPRNHLEVQKVLVRHWLS